MHRLTPLSIDEVLEYVQAIPGLVPSGVRLTVREIGDGNMNFVFRVTGQGDSETTSVIVKQALPYMRSVGAAWPLTADRILIEYETLETQHQLCPGSVPRVLHYDDELSLIVMEDLSSYIVLRDGLHSKHRGFNRIRTEVARNVVSHKQCCFSHRDVFGIRAANSVYA